MEVSNFTVVPSKRRKKKKKKKKKEEEEEEEEKLFSTAFRKVFKYEISSKSVQ